MTCDLYIGDRMFSSWSLRGWLLLEQFSIPFRLHEVGLYSGAFARDMAALAPARLVPSLRLPEENITISESLAIAETLAERHPQAGIWPAAAASRAVARWLCAEMASGFAALRAGCPMQLHSVWDGFAPSAEVRADLDRLQQLWAHARNIGGAEDGFLFGAYCAADAFFTPVAARIVGYRLPVSPGARRYCRHLLSGPAFKRWRAEALKDRYDPLPHDQKLPRLPWPDF